MTAWLIVGRAAAAISTLEASHCTQQLCVRVAALGEVRTAALDRLSWLAGGPSTRPATMSLLLYGCLRNPSAGAASSGN